MCDRFTKNFSCDKKLISFCHGHDHAPDNFYTNLETEATRERNAQFMSLIFFGFDTTFRSIPFLGINNERQTISYIVLVAFSDFFGFFSKPF